VAYITDSVLRDAVAISQGMTAASALPAYWLGAVPSANGRAYRKIRTVMRGRGFTTAQVDAWDDREDWNRVLGVCLACWDVSKASEDRGEAFRREYEALLEELMAADLTINGIVIDPTSAATRIAYGEFTTSTDIHTIDDEL